MAKIHVLSQDTINKIAAGEVIERPMAVVKELVENAIDAKANSITVEIMDGGKSLIRITDNGSGMAAEDIPLAFTPHATSKIKDIEDLLSVSSLGFRGEALASIAAVSQLELITKTREELMGCRYCIDGGKEKETEHIGCPDGTTFIVRNLFFNTPARLKFLKTAQTEAGYISGLLERMALSHPEISFRFINQKQTKLQTSGNGRLKDVIYHIYGRDITSNLLEVSSCTSLCNIEGYIGKPVISKGNRSLMNYFINGRYIKSTLIHRAIEEAYAPYSMQHRYPFTALSIAIDPKYIDVNVHPQKMEIRFNQEKEIYEEILSILKTGLQHREYIPSVHLTEQTKKKETRKEETIKKSSSITRPAEPFETKRTNAEKEQTVLKEKESKEKVLSKDENISKNKAIADTVIETKKAEENSAKDLKSSVINENRETVSVRTEERIEEPEENKEESLKKEAETKPLIAKEDRKEEPVFVQEKADYKVKQETLFDVGILSPKAQSEVQIIGQVFSTYWILQYEDAMYLVDQHAAHEKVLFERFMKELKEKKPSTQLLNPPIIISLSMIEQQAVEENRDIFEKLGYQLEHFGGREYSVCGVPAHLPDVGIKQLLMEVIDSISDNKSSKRTPDLLLEKVASMSCKAAVKGNNRLSKEEMQTLLKELMHLENPFHCPHGRPTMIKMTKKEIEKKFKRIVS